MAPTSILSLPPEIHQMIFHELEYVSDLYNVLLVCRAFKTEVERRMYGYLVFGPEDSSEVVVGAFEQVIRPTIGGYLKIMDLRPPDFKDWAGVPWSTLFLSVPSLKTLIISGDCLIAHLSPACPFRLSTLGLMESSRYSLEDVARLMAFFEVQTELEHLEFDRNVWPVDFQLPTSFTSIPSRVLPRLRILEAGDELCRQLVPGRPTEHLQIYSLPETFTSPPLSARSLRGLKVDDLPHPSALRLLPETYPNLRFLAYCVDWPLEMQELPDLARMRQLRILSLELPIRPESEDITSTPSFGYHVAQCTPIMSRILAECPSVGRLELVDPIPEKPAEDDYVLVMTRDTPEPFVEKFNIHSRFSV